MLDIEKIAKHQLQNHPQPCSFFFTGCADHFGGIAGMGLQKQGNTLGQLLQPLQNQTNFQNAYILEHPRVYLYIGSTSLTHTYTHYTTHTHTHNSQRNKTQHNHIILYYIVFTHPRGGGSFQLF